MMIYVKFAKVLKIYNTHLFIVNYIIISIRNWNMILKKFDLELPFINDDILLKLYSDSMIDDIITIALWSIWSIHKLVMLRNVTGKDDREKKLWHLYCNEIFIRLEINKVYICKKRKSIIV